MLIVPYNKEHDVVLQFPDGTKIKVAADKKCYIKLIDLPSDVFVYREGFKDTQEYLIKRFKQDKNEYDTKGITNPANDSPSV